MMHGAAKPVQAGCAIALTCWWCATFCFVILLPHATGALLLHNVVVIVAATTHVAAAAIVEYREDQKCYHTTASVKVIIDRRGFQERCHACNMPGSLPPVRLS